MLQQWTLSLNYMHHFVSAHFSEWLLGAHQERCFVNCVCGYVHACVRALFNVCVCAWEQNRICMYVSMWFFLCLCITVCVCEEHVRERAHAQSTHMWRWRVCVHACRMTFSEMWQREKKHLTHN